MAFAPCLLGYGIIARRLWDDPETVRGQGNPYWNWIEDYVADDYQAAVEAGEGAYFHAYDKSVPFRVFALRLMKFFWQRYWKSMPRYNHRARSNRS